MISSFGEDRKKMTELTARIDASQAAAKEFEALSREFQHWQDKLASVNQSFEELNVPLEYGDRKKMALFKRTFGLEFKVTEDQAIAFSFFNLNKTCPDQKCVITMDIENEQWKVLHMEPVVPGVEELLDQLNGGGDLKNFCKQVRLKFKDFISEHPDSN